MIDNTVTLSSPEDEVWQNLTTLEHPFKLISFGGSGSGKTHWALHLIQNRDTLIHPKIDHVYVIYGSRNVSQYAQLLLDDNVTLSACNPSTAMEEIFERPGNNLVFIDVSSSRPITTLPLSV